jgi:hypothetical protein
MAEETGEPILEELTQELERANQEILRLKGYAISTGLASSATAEGKVVRLRGIAISEGTHNGKYYPWEELSRDSFVDSFVGKPVVVDHKEGLPSEVGLVKAARRDPEQKAILVDLEIYDEARGKQVLYLMENSRPVGLSVQVWERVSHEDGREVARDLELQHLSLTMDPADKEARIVAKLSQSGQVKEAEMTEETKEAIQNPSTGLRAEALEAEGSGQALRVDDFEKLASQVGEDEVLIATRLPTAKLAEHGYPYYAYPKQGRGPDLAQRVADLEKRVAALEETVKKLSSRSEAEHEAAVTEESAASAQAESPQAENPPAEEPGAQVEEMSSREDEPSEEERTREALSQLHPADLIFLEQMAKRRERV